MLARRLLAVGAIAATAACAGSSDPTDGGGTGVPAANEVWMQNAAFNPASRTVASGTQVSFRNRDASIHNVTSSSVPAGASAISSGDIGANGTFSVTLTAAGTYQYHCTIHGTPTAGMRGTITVN